MNFFEAETQLYDTTMMEEEDDETIMSSPLNQNKSINTESNVLDNISNISNISSAQKSFDSGSDSDSDQSQDLISNLYSTT